MYFGEREPQWLIFGIFFWNWTLSVHVKPGQVFRPICLPNRFTELRHLKVKYKFVFYKVSSPPSPSPSSLLKLPIYSKNGKQNWSFQHILGLERPRFVPESFFFVTGVRVKFRFERLRNKLWSITFDNCEVWTYCSELWEQFTIFQATTGKTSMRTSCLYIRNGKLDTKWRSRQTKSRKENSKTALDGKFDT